MKKETKSRKIAILGTASTSADKAPYDDPSWEIWNIGLNYMKRKRLDLWFEIHSSDVLKAAGAAPEYFDFLKKTGEKVICGLPHSELPDATPYPLQAIMAEFGDYFTCSAAYMIAYALYLDIQAKKTKAPRISEIGLWGIDMMDKSEYSHQRPCCEYYLGIAKGRGINITIAPQSPLLRFHGLYAFADLKFSREMTERHRDLETDLYRQKQIMEQARDSFLRSEAMLTQIRDINNRWGL